MALAGAPRIAGCEQKVCRRMCKAPVACGQPAQPLRHREPATEDLLGHRLAGVVVEDTLAAQVPKACKRVRPAVSTCAASRSVGSLCQLGAIRSH